MTDANSTMTGQNTLEHYQALSVNLGNALERMCLLQQSLGLMGHCHTEEGLFSTLTEMIDSMVPVQDVSLFQKKHSAWERSGRMSCQGQFEVDTKLLDWAMARAQPAFISKDTRSENPGGSFLFMPLGIAGSPGECLVISTSEKKDNLSSQGMRMISVVHSEAIMALEKIRQTHSYKSSVHYFDRVLDSLSGAIFTVDDAGTIRLFNKNAEYYFGSPAIMAIDERVIDFFPREAAGEIMALKDRVLKNQMPEKGRMPNLFNNSLKDVTFEVQASPVLDGSNRVANGVVFVFQVQSIHQ